MGFWNLLHIHLVRRISYDSFKFHIIDIFIRSCRNSAIDFPEVFATHYFLTENLWIDTQDIDEITLLSCYSFFYVWCFIFDNAGMCQVVHREVLAVALHVHADILAEACQCTARDAGCHLCAADDKDIVFENILPDLRIIVRLTVVALRIGTLSTLSRKVEVLERLLLRHAEE